MKKLALLLMIGVVVGCAMSCTPKHETSSTTEVDTTVSQSGDTSISKTVDVQNN